ncbi:MAG TPA: SDR family NAD(P)-dependent oxidoreductase [Gammaproteobacteria bacterium]|nr:SDR family NAD(P)-dependent oxidoreductase [Gammaproteobacteria bacterium]
MALALVTGGGTGLGRAVTLALARRGMDVLAVGRRPEPLQETREREPDRVRVLPADVSREEGRAAIVETVGEGPLAYLVHNAGVLAPVAPLAEVSLEQWRAHQAINVEGPLFLTAALLEPLRGGRVLHVSSGAAHHAYRGWGAYCTSKAALHMVYQVYREELADHDIAVGSIRPGVVDTPMQARVRALPPEVFPDRERFVEMKRTGRLLDPARSAAAMVSLLLDTDAARFSRQEWDVRDLAGA